MRRAPGRLRELLGRGSPAPVGTALPAALAELARTGPAPLSGDKPAADAPLRIATIVPSFRRGSGGHMTIVNLMRELGELGHDVTLWLEDCEGRHAREDALLTRESFAEFFAWEGRPLHTDLGEWAGTDVVLATGWQTVARALLLPDVAARAYLVQDHEPDFYPASAERLFSEQTYRQGLHCIAASEWLAELLRTRYGASASHFDLAVDHAIYRSCEEPRRENLVAFYARAVTPRRAVPLGLMALTELARRRPNVEIALFGEDRPIDAPFAHTNLGVLAAEDLAALYRRATVGMVHSLTNPSLIGLEMMACGLACVDLASESMVRSFGHNGPLWLSEPGALEPCLALEGLLEDTTRREAMATAGRAFMSTRTWRGAASQLEHAVSSLVWRT
ncbi:MAG TPA: glycosyltransferase family 4 protein [Solirubrobacteraceae bacterium]|nr:glycosyltransferase family 4 protein [Solirubrobacteraceae bacterium]